jgi:AcrR family transcriptional regulator
MPTTTFFNLTEKKRQRILAAAIQEFTVRNLAEANISHIVKAAGISRGSFYQYFSSKEDLYIYIFSSLREERRRYTQGVIESLKSVPFLEFYRAFYCKNAEYLLAHPEHIKLGKHLYTCPLETSRSLIQVLQTRYKDMFLIGIEHDKGIGLLRENFNSAALAELLVHMCTDVFIFEVIKAEVSMMNIEENIDALLDIVRRGIIK